MNYQTYILKDFKLNQNNVKLINIITLFQK